MSRRAIRKLEQEKSASAVPEHSEESEGEAEVYDAGATLNPFGALEIAEVEVLGSGWHEANSGIAEGVASDVQQRQLGGDHEEGHREKETAAQEVLSSDDAPGVDSGGRQGIINDSERSKKASTKRRAKRSRQKKKKDVTQSPRDVSEKAVPGSSNMKIDALEESPSADLVAGDPQRLMFVDVKRLHPDRERRSLLRMRIYSADSESRTRPRNPSRAVPRFRRSIFSPPIEGFPDQAPGLSMKMLDSKCGVPVFEYEHSEEYAAIQASYMAVAEAQDYDGLVQLINCHPYHVDSLIQLGDIFRASQEPERAGKYVLQALLLLERAWHPSFKPFDHSCVLPETFSRNASLYVALYWYSEHQLMKGLPRTAFETTKVLINLDSSSDPYGALLRIDSLALLCREEEWILKMYETYRKIPVHLLPNFSYSAALAARRKGLRNASDILARAIATFPMTVSVLLQMCGDTSNFSKTYPQFSDNCDFKDKVFVRIAIVYGIRSKESWAMEHLGWLKEEAAKVASSGAIEGFAETRRKALKMLEKKRLFQEVRVSDFARAGEQVPRDVENIPVGPVDLNIRQGDILRYFISSLWPGNGAEVARNATAARVTERSSEGGIDLTANRLDEFQATVAELALNLAEAETEQHDGGTDIRSVDTPYLDESGSDPGASPD
eukprot:CAMPEP_0184754102 /NCGR_PEP_ID=MMETSP0315-20130426/44446_1 /TAXON_ID=101924 /ORGANISM="Rhodosorus marinus, Strain UTEX LB 2760" /LENGTH=665 /DNA_ID=CAMNT_0027233505 /DNA_START=231 /DNA_END=2228 /DNA_ORIENTATION=+